MLGQDPVLKEPGALWEEEIRGQRKYGGFPEETHLSTDQKSKRSGWKSGKNSYDEGNNRLRKEGA